MPGETTVKDCDVAFEDYKGVKRYTVSHPAHKRDLRVAAPDENAAMVAAAERWGERWQSIEFYAYCLIVPDRKYRR